MRLKIGYCVIAERQGVVRHAVGVVVEDVLAVAGRESQRQIHALGTCFVDDDAVVRGSNAINGEVVDCDLFVTIVETSQRDACAVANAVVIARRDDG